MMKPMAMMSLTPTSKHDVPVISQDPKLLPLAKCWRKFESGPQLNRILCVCACVGAGRAHSFRIINSVHIMCKVVAWYTVLCVGCGVSNIILKESSSHFYRGVVGTLQSEGGNMVPIEDWSNNKNRHA